MGSFGSGRLGNEGVSSPSRLSGLPASAPRTAHLCRSRGAGDSRAAGAPRRRARLVALLRSAPQNGIFLPLVCPPQSEAGAVTEAAH